MYSFSPGAMLAVGSPGGFYLVLARLLLPTRVCIQLWSQYKALPNIAFTETSTEIQTTPTTVYWSTEISTFFGSMVQYDETSTMSWYNKGKISFNFDWKIYYDYVSFKFY